MRDQDAGKVRGPEALMITRGKADDRLASRIIDSCIALDGGKIAEVEDFLIEPKSGRITR